MFETFKGYATVASNTVDQVIIAGITGRKIRIAAMILISSATAASITFLSKGTGAGTAITPSFPNAGNGGFCANFNSNGWFETNVGESLTATVPASTNPVAVLYDYIKY